MNASADVDGVLRRYLLGSASDEIRDDVEKRLFSDDRVFWEHLCLVEDELIDAYVGNELDPDEIQQFEARFLSTGERQRKLEFARALKGFVDSDASTTPSRGRRITAKVAAPTWAVAAAATLVIALSAVGWQLAARHVPATEMSVWLTSGLSRGYGQIPRLQIPSTCKVVRVQLETDDTRALSFQASLHEVGGAEISTQNRLSLTKVDGRSAVTVTLPSELLKPGDYYVRLRGVNEGAEILPVGRYDFRVLP